MKKINFEEIKNPKKRFDEEYLLEKMDIGFKLILARGECRTGGYDVKLKKAEIIDDILEITIEFINPEPKGFVTMALTYPTREYYLDITEKVKKVVIKSVEGDIIRLINSGKEENRWS